ncbi:MAG: hypothetical protein ACJ8LN_09175 [Sulfurifustis sp.]
MQAVIESLAYSLGESEHAYSEVVNFQEFLKANGYPDKPELFGWGKYRKTAADIFDLGIASARKTLASSGLSPADIDFVYFCSTCFPGDEIEHIKFNVKLLKELQLTNTFPVGFTLNNCASFLSAIVMAVNMVRTGAYKNILIITADKVYDENIRFNNFALLSDAAASCIVTSRNVAGYELVADRFRASEDPIHSNRGKDDSALYARVLREIIDQAGVKVGQVRKVFCSNIFRSITQLKEMKLGFSKGQLFLDNVPKYGHCFSADTFINLIDYSSSNPASDSDLYMVSVDAPNLRASVLLRRTGG